MYLRSHLLAIYQSFILLKRERDELVLKIQLLRFFRSSNPPVSTINEKTLQVVAKKFGRSWEACRLCRDSALTETWIMSCFSGIAGTRGWSPPSKASHHGRAVDFFGRNPGTLPGAFRCYGNAKKNHESIFWCGYLRFFDWNGFRLCETLVTRTSPDKICLESYGQFQSHLQRYTYSLQLSLSYNVNGSRPLDHT